MTSRDLQLVLLAFGLSGALFAADVVTPQGVAVGVLYAIPVLLSLWASRSWHVWAAAVHGSVFAILAFALKPDGHLAPTWMAVTNRGFALVAIWTAALIVALNHETRRRLDAARAEADRRALDLADSRKRLEDVRYALDQAAIVAITDRRGIIVHANDKFCEVSGYAREELLGQDHRILNSGLHGKAFFAEMWRTIAAGIVWRGEMRNRAKSGKTYWVDTTIVPLMGPDGRPEQYLAIRTDITERKRAEEALRRQEALARLGEMAAIVAHEVKNPLTGIAGALQVIGGRMPADSPDRRVVGDMLDRIWALHRSLQDLLVFARPRALDRKRVALDQLARDSARLLTGDARYARMQVEVTGPPVVVYADPDLLREALLNVLLNAGQATEGKGVLRIEVGEADDGPYVRVADDGPGIPPDVRERVFEPFFTTKVRGTGLGLPIVRRTLELHGGTATVACPEGGGTVVTLQLPRPDEKSMESVSNVATY